MLLAALWLVALLLETLVRDALGLPRNWAFLRAYLFLIGLGFFGWFWTHGGQTLGMRAWRLEIRTADEAPLTWPRAALRYAIAWISWLALGLGMLWCLVDARRRAWHDVAAGTEVVQLPR